MGSVSPLDHAAACRDGLTRRADLRTNTTARSVDDLDDLREWLGYPPLNLIGVSYGSRVAQVYFSRLKDGPVEVKARGRTLPFDSGDLAYALRGILYVRGRKSRE